MAKPKKYTDFQLERILSAHACGLLKEFGYSWPWDEDFYTDYQIEDGIDVEDAIQDVSAVRQDCRACINQAAYLMPDPDQAADANNRMADWFDNQYRESWTVDRFLAELLRAQDRWMVDDA